MNSVGVATDCSGHAGAEQRVTGSPNSGVNMRKVRRITILELVEAVQDTAGSDAEVVAVLSHLLKAARLPRQPVRQAA